MKHVSRAFLSKSSFYELPRLANKWVPVLVNTVDTILRDILVLDKVPPTPREGDQPNTQKQTKTHQGADDQLDGAMRALRSASLEIEGEDESNLTSLSSHLFSGKASPTIELRRPIAACAGFSKLRDMMELLPALPPTFLNQGAKQQGSRAVLVLDWILRAVLVCLDLKYGPSTV